MYSVEHFKVALHVEINWTVIATVIMSNIKNSLVMQIDKQFICWILFLVFSKISLSTEVFPEGLGLIYDANWLLEGNAVVKKQSVP